MINIGSIWESSGFWNIRDGQLLVVEQVYSKTICFRTVSLYLTHTKHVWPIKIFLKEFKLITDVKQ